MYLFQYRAPRFFTDFPIDLVVGESTLRGRCNNINVSGLQAEFAGQPIVGSMGMLTLSYSADAFKLYARVTYVASTQTGIAFIFRTEYERGQLRQFVESQAKGKMRQVSQRESKRL